MSFHIFDHEASVSQSAADWLVDRLSSVLTERETATWLAGTELNGTDGPLSRLHAELVGRHARALDWGRVRVVQLCEYADTHVPREDRIAHRLVEDVIAPLGSTAYLMWQGDVGHEYPVTPAGHARHLPAIDVATHALMADGGLGFLRLGSRHAGQVAMLPSEGGAHDLDAPRLTLTLAPIMAARHSLVLATGAARRDALDGLTMRVPVSMSGDLAPANAIPLSRLSIMADHAAAMTYMERRAANDSACKTTTREMADA